MNGSVQCTSLSSLSFQQHRESQPGGLGIKQDPISKITNAERADGVAQLVEYLHS
jgi:hypothetical protein